MNLEIKSIECYQLKGEQVLAGEEVTFTGEYWPPFMSNTPNNCPLRTPKQLEAAKFAACISCEHAIISLVE